MTAGLDATDLDDVAALEAGDPQAMLRVVATSGAQVREAVTLAQEAGVAGLAEEGAPRSVVVTGMGGSAIAGDIFAALTGPGCPIPVVVHRGYGLPRWVGAADLVIPVSCSGTTEETLSAAEEAARRGCSLLGVGAADSPLEAVVRQGRGRFVTVPQGRQPRASVWALSTPLVLAADALGLLEAPPETFVATAQLLDDAATRCRPSSDHVVNPAKTIALDLQGRLPMVWGTSAIANVAAYRLVCQLAENAKSPAIPGALPEANHNQVVAFDGPYGARAGGRTGSADDLFRDRGDEVESQPLRLVLLRDLPAEEHPQVARRADVSAEIAGERGVEVTELVAEGESPFERLASLVAVPDFATVYLALLLGIDPTPVAPIQDLKERIRR